MAVSRRAFLKDSTYERMAATPATDYRAYRSKPVTNPDTPHLDAFEYGPILYAAVGSGRAELPSGFGPERVAEELEPVSGDK